MARRLSCLGVAVVLLTGCTAERGAAGTPAPATSPHRSAAPVSTAPTPSRADSPTPTRTTAANPKLRKELLAMLKADQADRLGNSNGGVARDQARTERLGEIVDSYGWPTRTLVGTDGATAVWAIAQHSDLDPQFQQRMLELMRPAVDAGEADPGELAYLTDRVAANAGQPQTYGTQMGCGADGKPQLARLAQPDRVDELRAEAGLPTLEEYLAELAKVCAQPQ